MTESHSYRMRLDPAFMDELQATIPEKGRGGRAGGLSLLFRRLGHLYLRKPLPAQRWRDDLGISEEPQHEDIAKTFDDIETELHFLESKVWVAQKKLTPKELKRAQSLSRDAEALTEPQMKGPANFDQHRGLVLVGRLRLLLRRHEKRDGGS